MKRLLLLFVLLCLLPAPAISMVEGDAAAGSGDLLLFYSSDVAGETEPCG